VHSIGADPGGEPGITTPNEKGRITLLDERHESLARRFDICVCLQEHASDISCVER
jgi:hypothetical protein